MKNIITQKSVLAILSILISFTILAQTGPAGVGTSSTNKLWLKADANVYSNAGTTSASDGNLVQQWNDQSGNGNNASQATSANRPTYKSNVGGKPTLVFSGDQYIDPSALGILGTGGFTYLVVFKDTSYTAGSVSDGSGDYLLDRTTGTNELAGLKIASTSKYGFQKRDNSGSGLGGPITTTDISTSSFQLIDYMRERGTAYRLYLNGTQEANAADADGDLTPPAPRIGRHATATGGGIKGYISELIIYNYKVTNAQLNILNSYLASKYSLTISNNKYSYGSTYGTDVAGIGKESDGSHLSANSNRLNISASSLTSNGDYVLLGHDAGTNSFCSSNIPSGINDRIGRLWRVSKTNYTGNIIITLVDSSGISLVSGQQYKFLVSSTSDFSSSTSYTFSASTITLTNAQLATGSYITIARTAGTVIAPSSFSYSPSSYTTAYGVTGTSSAPSVNDGGSFVTYSLQGTVPTGVTINSSSGVITFASTMSPSSGSVTSRATNSAGYVETTVSYTISTGVLSSLTYSNSGTQTGSVNFAITNLTATTNTASLSGVTYVYSWNVSNPYNGISLNTSTGTISGIPTVSGTYSATVSVTASGNATGTTTCAITITVYGSTGPGGIGDATTNKLWLKADASVYNNAGTTTAANGDLVQQWNDQSGNSNNTSQATSANKPTYKTNVVNSKPALRFNGDQFIDAGSLGIAGTGGFTYLFVVKDTTYTAGGMSDGSGDYIIDRTGTTNELAGLKISSTSKYGFQKRDNSSGGIGGPVSATDVVTSSFMLIDYMRDRGTAYRLYLNGLQDAYVADADGDLTPPTPRIGRHATTTNNGIKGYISEVIIYNYKVSDAQLNILNSYLAAKYNLTISSNKFSYGSTHGNDVAGVGQESNGSHLSATTGRLNLGTSALSGNGSYLLIGHDGGTNSFTSTNVPSGVGSRLGRVWRVNRTSYTGTVTIKIDTTSLNASNLRILVSSASTFASATVYTWSGSGVSFDNTTLPDGAYITLGSTNDYATRNLNTTGNWNSSSNWTFSTIPTTTEDATISSTGTVTTNTTINNLTIGTGNTLTINSGVTLTVTGNISSSGTINGSGTLLLAGTTAQTIGGTISIANITLNNSLGVTLNSSSTSVSVTSTLTLTNGTLTTNGKLTLVSNVSGTARIATISGTADITGNVTTQRYLPSIARRYRMLSSPNQNFTWSQLIDNMFVTGTGGDLNGFDPTTTNSSSCYTYQEATTGTGRGWKAPSGITNSVSTGLGTLVFVRGDRTLASPTWYAGPTFPSQNAVTLDFTSQPINKGNISPSITYTSSGTAANDGWNLVGNPYPSQIDWSLLTKSNLSSFFYIIDPSTGSYVSANSGVIASGQAFFVQANAASPSITFTESAKTSSTAAYYFKTAPTQIQVKMIKDSLNSDLAWLEFNSSSSLGYNPAEDAMKFMNATVNVGFYIDTTTLLQFSSVPLSSTIDTFTLFANASSGTYTLVFSGIASNVPASKAIYLRDLYNSNLINLRTSSSYSFTISSSSASHGNRFQILIGNTSSLPVTWLSFNGQKINETDVKLNWQTANEKNNSHFEVQKTIDYGLWTTIGNVNANGTTNSVNSYQFTDVLPTNNYQSSTIYYRLKQVDLNGEYSYSQTISINNKNNNVLDEMIMLYPVPTKDELTIKLKNYFDNEVKIDVINVVGKTIQTIYTNGKDDVKINTQALNNGIYLLQFSSKQNKTYTTKFVKE